MKKTAAAFVALVVLTVGVARAQTMSAEVAQTVGGSNEGLTAAATQVRLFGDAGLGTTFHLETAWGARSGEDETDAFSGAYPYGNRWQMMEVYGERTFRPGPALLAVHGGRFRTPFGISAGSDHGYSGFLRAPLMRYEEYWGLSNNFRENGAGVVAGIPSLYVEATVGKPADVGELRRSSGVDKVVRGQGSYRGLILGMSYISTMPNWQGPWISGRAKFTGVDGRWMKSGIEIRGEWIFGQPFNTTRTRGGYLDLLLHRPGLGPVTAVLRAEKIDYITIPQYSMYGQRYTAGARVRIVNSVAAQVNVMHQHGLYDMQPVSLDAAVTYTYRLDARRSK